MKKPLEIPDGSNAIVAPDGGARINDAWVAAHTTFHAGLAAACDSRWTLNLRAMLYAQSERYRQLSYVLARENRDVDGEYKGILDACLAGNADLACGLIDEHLTRTSDILVTSPALRDTQRQAAVQ